MNRRERRARARRMAKGREERRTLARAMKVLEVPQEVREQRDPYPTLREKGFTIAAPELKVPGQEVLPDA